MESQSSLRLVACLKAARTISPVISKITRILWLLVDKRATLAEKAIKLELASCVNIEGLLTASLALSLINPDCLWEIEDCRKLRQLNIKLNKQLKAFLKASAYDLNYLEQYFEHDFWLEFKNNNFVGQLADLLNNKTIRNY